jgi:hypothetical protein
LQSRRYSTRAARLGGFLLVALQPSNKAQLLLFSRKIIYKIQFRHTSMRAEPRTRKHPSAGLAPEQVKAREIFCGNNIIAVNITQVTYEVRFIQ